MIDLLSCESEITFSHLDNHGRARPSFLWALMQDAATTHADARGLGQDSLHVLWVLSRVRAALSRPLLPHERIRCDTWCPGAKGASWYRCFSFFAGDEPVGGAQSMWVTLDPASRRILRPTSLPAGAAYLRDVQGDLFAPLPKLSCGQAAPHHIHPVCYSDLDVNNHVNNARVVELVSDALDLQDEAGFLSSLQVNYIAETVCGEQVTLLRGQSDGAQYVRGEADGQPRFEALATLSPLSKGGSCHAEH